MSDCGIHLRIRGMVQGVGFRYFCYRAARDLGLTGWTRNLPDGSVELEAEGDRSLIEQLIREVTAGPSHANVTDVDPTWKDFTGKYTTFDIRG